MNQFRQKRGDADSRPLENSILSGKKQCCDGSVGLGDHPERFGFVDAIAAHQAESELEPQFIFGLIFLAEVALVSPQMP